MTRRLAYCQMCGAIFLTTRPRLIVDDERREMRSADVLISMSATIVGGLCARHDNGRVPPVTDDDSEAQP